MEKVQLSERIKLLDYKALSNLVFFIYETKKELLEDINDEKLHIRLDLIDRDTFNKVLQ